MINELEMQEQHISMNFDYKFLKDFMPQLLSYQPPTPQGANITSCHHNL